MDYKYSILLIIIVSFVTVLLRFLPFVIFNKNNKVPNIVSYLGKILPFAVMGMLVVYCYKDIKILTFPYGLPEIIAGTIVILLHFWKKNTLLSIVTGTVIYMILIQFVFI